MMESPGRALVTGATGAVGPATVRCMLQKGWDVVALGRRAPPAGSLPPGVDFLAADIRDRKALAEACHDVDAVIHLAAKLHTYHLQPADLSDYRAVNVDATADLLDSAQDAGAKRFVFLSTVNVYGPSPPGITHDEASPLKPSGFYEETKATAERVVRQFPGATVLRSAAVYGPNMKGNYVRLARAVQAGRFVPIGRMTNRRTLVHEDDLAAACWLAATHPRAAGATFNVTDGAVHQMRDVIAAIAKASGRRPPTIHLPASPVRSAIRLMERSFALTKRPPPITVKAFDKLTEDMAVQGVRLRDELGFKPRHGLEAGWAATMDAWAANRTRTEGG